MTVTPGERHNYLAIKLSRYREKDPYIAAGANDSLERLWIGSDGPSIQAAEEDVFEVNVPGYDLRRMIQARDPLACAMAFAVQIRRVLATLFGIRMCPKCPHCAESDRPCQDAFGSNAEPQGGVFGRVAALFGMNETQKGGTLQLHFDLYVQRAHQHPFLQEIAEMLRQRLLHQCGRRS